MNERTGNNADRRSGSRELRCRALCLGLMIALGAGCAHDSLVDKPGRTFTRVYTPQVPEFLSGPGAALLTNTAGFSARATYQSRTPQAPEGVDTMEGELLARGTLLLFAARTADTAKKELEAGGFSFIWDVATASGFVLSEALQGYAPVTSSVKVSTVTPVSASGDEQTAVVTLNNGSGWLFRWKPSAEMKQVPSKLDSVTNAPAFSLKLSRLRPEAPPSSLFEPPQGFARFPSPEALADELAARKNNIRRGKASEALRIYEKNYGR